VDHASISLRRLEGTVETLLPARDDLEARLLIAPAARVGAAGADGAAGLANITGIGIGEQVVGGRPTGRVALKVFVREKLPAARLAAAARVPRRVDGFPTDVEALGEVAAPGVLDRRRPRRRGASISHAGVGVAGTPGCLVRRGRGLYILGNNHVLALVNRAPLRATIVHPARLDGGVVPRDIVARLARFVPIDFAAVNQVDAAIARTTLRLLDRRGLRAWSRRRPGGPATAPALGMRVRKSGRTTRRRRGRIDAVHVTLDVSYAPLGGVARFAHQFRVRGVGATFSEIGDSGSLVLTEAGNRPVGLLFSGSAAGNMAFCNEIARVTSALGVSIVP
jgi:hypothetical protein